MWWLLGLVGISLIRWGLVSARQALYPERHALPGPPAASPSHTTHAVIAPDGASFDVWLLEPPSSRGHVLLCHGYYAGRSQVMGIAEGLRERGYAVALFELRGHGERPGPCTFGVRESEDAVAVLEWWASRDSATRRTFGVLGLSMGAAVVCHAAARRPEILAVVTDSAYCRLFPVLSRAIRQRYHLPAIPFAWVTWWCVELALGRRLASYDPCALAPRLRQPLFAIQGGADQRVQPHRALAFYVRWAGPKERWFDPCVPHVAMFAHDPRAYCDRVAAFFNRTLPQTSAG